jgi:hypothetical protein
VSEGCKELKYEQDGSDALRGEIVTCGGRSGSGGDNPAARDPRRPLHGRFRFCGFP